MESVLPIRIVPAYGRESFEKNDSSFLRHVKDHFVPHARNNFHPHIFSHRMTALLSLLLVSVKIFGLAAISFGPVESAYSSAITQTNIISLTNQSRAALSLSPLTENSLLTKAAQTKADDMLAKGYFAHNTPDGKTPWDFVVSAGYSYISAGENLAVNFSEAENVEDAWMNSPGHRANIVNKNFQEIGVGISQGEYQGHAAIFVVQMFGTPAEQKITLQEKPTVVETQKVPVPQVSQRVLGETAHKEVVENIPAPQVSAQPLAILEQKTEVVGANIVVSIKTSGEAVKVVVSVGQEGAVLTPKENNTWQGLVPLASVQDSEKVMLVKVFDMKGNYVTGQVAEFSGSTPANYAGALVSTQKKSAQFHIGQWSFSVHSFEYSFYLLFIAIILVSLIVAIAVHKHVQHISLVANASFVAIIAILLWV